MTLPASVEAKIKEIGETHFHDPSDFKARGAREMAEWLCELVCPKCGRPGGRATDCPHCKFPVGILGWITRAEFLRRNP